MSEPKQVVGMFCYKDQKQYDDFLKIFTDSDALPRDFFDWEQKANNGIKQQAKLGVHVIRVYAESTEEFTTWCRVNGRDINTKGRLAFTNFKLAQQLKRS